MRSQTVVSTAKIMERIRVHGNSIHVVEDASFEADLARQLEMPEFSPAELAEAVEGLVDEGRLRAAKGFLSLGSGGISGDPVTEDVITFSVVITY